MATCLDLAGAKFPAEFAGKPTKPPEGVSLRPAFSGRPLARTSPLFWEHESNRAVRAGRWKLVAMENQKWELHDMDADRTELHDLAAHQPDKVREFTAAWDAWAKRADVLPLGSWKPVYRTPGK
jgi:arylsulfatase